MKLQTRHQVFLAFLMLSFQACQDSSTPLSAGNFFLYDSLMHEVQISYTDDGQTIVSAEQTISNPITEVIAGLENDYESYEDFEIETLFLETSRINESFETRDLATITAATMTLSNEVNSIQVAGPDIISTSSLRKDISNDNIELVDFINENDQLILNVEVVFDTIIEPTFIAQESSLRIQYSTRVIE